MKQNKIKNLEKNFKSSEDKQGKFYLKSKE